MHAVMMVVYAKTQTMILNRPSRSEAQPANKRPHAEPLEDTFISLAHAYNMYQGQEHIRIEHGNCCGRLTRCETLAGGVGRD